VININLTYNYEPFKENRLSRYIALNDRYF